MARPLRIEYENACYHVIDRGNHKEEVFYDKSDCELFLKKLVEFAELYDVVIYAYCLMPNHFHLMIRTRLANLGKFMQTFLTSFTIIMNRKYSRAGHLFQGRYKAQLVESELYKNQLSRYIHLNPVKIKMPEQLDTETLKSRLEDYRWSSYRSYIGLERLPKWLDRRFVLASWGQNAEEKINNYQNYVERGISVDNSTELNFPGSHVILGSEKFRESIERKYLKSDVHDIDSREQPVLAKITTYSVEEIFKSVLEYYNINELERITVRRGRHSLARRMAMFLVAKYCRRKESLTSLAARFDVKISGLNMAADKFKSALKTDENLRDDVLNVENILKSNKMEV